MISIASVTAIGRSGYARATNNCYREGFRMPARRECRSGRGAGIGKPPKNEAASHQQMNRLLPDDRARSTPRCVLLDENHSLLGGTTSA